MVLKPEFGNWLSIDILDSLDKYILLTMEEPWKIIENKVTHKPSYIEYNYDMSSDNLQKLYDRYKQLVTNEFSVVGIGGGTACDSAKYFAWKFKEEFDYDLDLYLMPSIISVDAFLCSSIAVRDQNKVKYIGESNPKNIIIDFDLIKTAPSYLNRAGVSDTISITSALGDWIIAREEIEEKFDRDVFNRAKNIAEDLMDARNEIRDVSEKGIKALVQGFYDEVFLCEEWGNARPEEGSEHFLAYCLESLTGEHYIHGNLIGMNTLISLYLQEEYAQFSLDLIKKFLKDIELNFTPKSQNISNKDLERALKHVKQYVVDEKLFYSIYNSPNLILNNKKIEKILKFIKSI
jgi:glycerol dehydrogenase-like iron-containing ADH family enzyme